MKRVVKEDMSLADKHVQINHKKGKARVEDDYELQTLEKSLKNFETEFGKTANELAEIFCLVSGRLQKVREYLTHEKKILENSKNGSQMSMRSKMESLKDAGVVVWTYLEDLALKKPEDSPEF